MATTDDKQGTHLEKLLDELRSYLRTETNIRQSPESDEVEVSVTATNAAPRSNRGGDVVFVGVGLVISDGRQDRDYNQPRWTRDIRSQRQVKEPRRSLAHGRFPLIALGKQRAALAEETNQRDDAGEILFPGEAVSYQMQIPKADLPFLSLQIEGSVSRRQLYHFVQDSTELEQWTKPALVDAFRALSAADVHGPLAAVTKALPQFGPQTTLEQIGAFRQTVAAAMDQISRVARPSLNDAYHSAPKSEIRQHCKEVVGRYLSSVEKACSNALEALSSADTQRMQQAADGFQPLRSAANDVDRASLRLMERLGVTPAEVNFHEAL